MFPYELLPYAITANAAVLGFVLQRLWQTERSRPLDLELPE